MCLQVYIILMLASLVSVGEGSCACREYRCSNTEERRGQCQTTASYDGWGYVCCTLPCTCQQNCERIEPGWIEADGASCPYNQTRCCPRCSCKEKCNVADTQITECGINHVMCCDTEKRNKNCETDTMKFTKVNGLNICGNCSCQKDCVRPSLRIKSNKCINVHNLCCENCSCKKACDVTEIDTTKEVSTDQQCAGNLRKCCGTCKCKEQCQTAEKERMNVYSCFGRKRCCNF